MDSHTMIEAPTEAVEFPPLPTAWCYAYEWSSPLSGVRRSFDYRPCNGIKHDRNISLFTEDQMRAYLLADRAARAQTQGEPAGWILMPTTLTESWATYAQGAFMDHGWSATECFAARYAELIAMTRRASALAASPPMQPATPKGAQGSATDGEADHG